MFFTRIAPQEVVPEPVALAWHETPAFADFIAALDLDELFLTRKMVVMGDDCLHFTGDPVERLIDMRGDFIDEAFGCTYRESRQNGREEAYIDFEATQPRVDDVLAIHFGDPREFGSEDAHEATLMMRFMAHQKAAVARRAA